MIWRTPNASRLLRALIDPALGLALMLGYVGLLLSSVHDLGYARDEGFYFAAAQSYEGWFELLFRDPARALDPATADRYWSANHEHPAFMKSLFALSHHYLYEKWRLFSEAGTAYRFPGMLVSSLAIGVTYFWGRRCHGRLAGVVSALLLGMMPSVFYNSHLACFDMPVAAMWLVTTYAYARSLEAGGIRWPLLTGVLYGLLLNTKHNAWLFPAALGLHLLVTRAPELLRGMRAGRLALPSALFSIAVIGPLLFYATWPWIWRDTGQRIADWIAFHTGHEYYNMEFLGRTYWKPPMPRAYAWLMTLATVPAITLLLSGVGGVATARRIVRTRNPASQSTELLWLVCIVTSYAPWLSSTTPIFGGTKHWLTAYPFLCLFAAGGFSRVARGLSGIFDRFGERFARYGIGEIALAMSVVAAPIAFTLHSHPWGLSSYTPLVGGAPGAASLGLNRTFWGYTTGAVQEFLNKHAPPSAAVYVHDTALQSWEMMVRDGRLRRDLRGTLSIADSHIALYHHEPHMSRVEQQVWVAYGTAAPAYVGAFDGVPVIWVYARPGSLVHLVSIAGPNPLTSREMSSAGPDLAAPFSCSPEAVSPLGAPGPVLPRCAQPGWAIVSSAKKLQLTSRITRDTESLSDRLRRGE